MERAPHPWNTSFEWDDHAGAATTASADQLVAFDRDGFFVFEDAFDAATLAELDTELSPGDAKVKEFLAGMDGGRYSVAGLDTQTVAPHAVMRSEYARAFVAHPVLAGLASDLVGPDVRLYWEQSVYKQPNSAEPVLFHQDNGYTFTEPQAYLTCWIAITDATPENGCVSVMPGVHRSGTLAHRNTPIGEECWGDWSGAVDVPVRAGSIVVFSSLTPHATKRNTTNDVRKSYIVQYAPDDALVHFGDANAGPPTRTQALADDARCFPVVVNGRRVPAAAPR
jgi:ectoine hydroxylase-related dioxygenase (phytanoyl-CoA dioxygenase family)